MIDKLRSWIEEMQGKQSKPEFPKERPVSVDVKHEPVKVVPSETATEAYARLEAVRDQLKELDVKTRAVGEKIRNLRESTFSASMNKRFWGSPIGDAKGVQSALNQKAHARMVTRYEVVKSELKLAEKERDDLAILKKELEDKLSELQKKFTGLVTIESIQSELNQANE